mgnify:CR=1 FL=1
MRTGQSLPLGKDVACITGKGYVGLFEYGGSRGSHGEAYIICDKGGKPKTPIALKHEVNGRHALFIANHSDYVIRCLRDGKRVAIWIATEIDKVQNPNGTVATGMIKYSVTGKSVPSLPKFLRPAVKAAIRKSRALYCKEACYVPGKVPWYHRVADALTTFIGGNNETI